MIGPTRIRALRLLAVALAALLMAALVATAASSVSLRAASAGLRALQMAAGALCAPGETGIPDHPAGHGHLGDCCCSAVAHPDALPPPAMLARPAHPAVITRADAIASSAPGHPAGRKFIEARGPPAFV